MRDKLKGAVITGTVIAALAGGGVAVAGAAGGDDDATDKPIPVDARGKAGAAALEHLGEGKVSATEVGDEEGFYEVEVTRPGGGEVDVHLDRNFDVLGDEAEGEGSEDEGSQDD